MTVISGGDSRSSRDGRRTGNRLVAKIRPEFIAFGGDYTAGNEATVQFVSSGGQGDADLIVRHATTPADDGPDCEVAKPANDAVVHCLPEQAFGMSG